MKTRELEAVIIAAILVAVASFVDRTFARDVDSPLLSRAASLASASPVRGIDLSRRSNSLRL